MGLRDPATPSNPATFSNPLMLSNADDIRLTSPSQGKDVHANNSTPTASNPLEGKTTAVVAVMRGNPKDGYTRLRSINSLSAMDGHDRPLKNYLHSTVFSCQFFIGSQSLIARWTRNDFILPAVACNFYEACFIVDVSRGSKLYLFFTC
jgi:hypothetical protein